MEQLNQELLKKDEVGSTHEMHDHIHSDSATSSDLMVLSKRRYFIHMCN